MRDPESIETSLLTRGGPFEIREENVLGATMPVFATRHRSLSELLDGSLAHGDLECLVCGERRMTFAEHHRSVERTRAMLRHEFGVGKGDRVAILAANCLEWLLAFWATVSLGGIAVGMNGWWAGDEIRYALADSEPRLLLGDRKRLERLGGTRLAVPVVELGRDFEILVSRAPEACAPESIDEDDPAVILYTSGTTGRPKGAVATHRSIIALVGIQAFHGARLAARAHERGEGIPTSQHVRLNAAPLFHVSGLYSAAVAQLAAGVRAVWTVGRFDPEEVLRLIDAERVNGWGPLGPMAVRVARHPRRAEYDLSSVRSIGCGGAPVTPAVQAALLDAFPSAGSGLAVGYGLTECGGLATMITGDELRAHPDSVGHPLPTVAIEIRDERGNPLPEGAEGEVAIRSPLVMKEYWRDPEATAGAITPDRWLRSGDIGRIVGGRLFISTRKRDLILRGAENVYPAEIENRLVAHPEVAEAAVIGVDHPELGQEVKAFVVPRGGAAVDFDELARWVAATLAHFKVPSKWELRAEPLPRNASGKVMKWLLAPGTESPLLPEG